jgi:hypothetical protein
VLLGSYSHNAIGLINNMNLLALKAVAAHLGKVGQSRCTKDKV